MATSQPVASTFRVVDIHTRKPVGRPYSCAKLARAQRDRLDLRYGAIRYRVEAV